MALNHLVASWSRRAAADVEWWEDDEGRMVYDNPFHDPTAEDAVPSGPLVYAVETVPLASVRHQQGFLRKPLSGYAGWESRTSDHDLPSLTAVGDGTFVIVDGHHRLAQSQQAGATHVRARVGRRRTAALGGTPGTVRFYHGTNAAAVEQIRRDGEFRPLDPKAFVTGIEREYGLPPGSVWDAPGSTFTHTRVGDPDVYLTQHRDRAEQYARIGSEVLNDTLWSAASVATGSHDQSPGSPAARWVDHHLRRHGITPVVVTLDLPWEWITERRRTGGWTIEDFASGDPFSSLPGPIPASFIVEVSPA